MLAQHTGPRGGQGDNPSLPDCRGAHKQEVSLAADRENMLFFHEKWHSDFQKARA